MKKLIIGLGIVLLLATGLNAVVIDSEVLDNYKIKSLVHMGHASNFEQSLNKILSKIDYVLEVRIVRNNYAYVFATITYLERN